MNLKHTFAVRCAPGRANHLDFAAQLALLLGLAACGGGGGDVDAPAADLLSIDYPLFVDPMEGVTDTPVLLSAGELEASTTTVGDGSTATAAGALPAGEVEAGEPGDDARSFAMSGAIGGTPADCTAAPAIPAPPSNAKKVTSYGAVPNDSIDDTAAIQAALDSLKSGESLVFPAGKYLHKAYLRLKTENTRLFGKGATLHGTNPDSLSLMISADNTAVYQFTLTAVTNTRKSAAWHARISVFKDDITGKRLTARNVTIQGNIIKNAGSPGTAEANSASSAGILLSDVDGFLVVQNSVARTLADGIHMTGGSKNGRVIGNTVRETGDDMIAVVSYAQGGNAVLNTAAGLREVIADGSQLNKNIMVLNNTVVSNYWGRGITVAGADGVSVRGNTVTGVPQFAGILVIRDHNYKTFGVNNVIVENNKVEKIQNTTPPYNPNNKWNGARSDHGMIEIESFLFDDEKADSVIREAFSVKNVIVRSNTLINSTPGGVRTGTYGGGTLSAIHPATGKKVYRTYSNGDVKKIAFNSNTMSAVRYGFQFQTPSSQTSTLSCSSNTLNGVAISTSSCQAAPPVVSGANVSCTSSGFPNS